MGLFSKKNIYFEKTVVFFSSISVLIIILNDSSYFFSCFCFNDRICLFLAQKTIVIVVLIIILNDSSYF